MRCCCDGDCPCSGVDCWSSKPPVAPSCSGKLEAAKKTEPYITVTAMSNLESHKIRHYGTRAFSVSAPNLWNSLLLEIRSAKSVNIFKGKVKTLLFKPI